MFRIYQVQLCQSQHLRCVADIANTKNTLASVHALPPETKQSAAQLQGELHSVRVKCGLLPTHRQQVLDAGKHSAVVTLIIRQGFLQLGEIPLVPINGAVLTRVLHTGIVITRA